MKYYQKRFPLTIIYTNIWPIWDQHYFYWNKENNVVDPAPFPLPTPNSEYFKIRNKLTIIMILVQLIYFSVKIYVSSEKRHERLFIKYLITVISLLSSATLNDAKIYTLVWWRNGVPPQTLRGNGVHSRISQPRIKEIFVSFWILKMHQSNQKFSSFF